MRTKLWPGIVCLVLTYCAAAPVSAQQKTPLAAAAPREGDFVVRDFKFSDGQSLSELRMHYTTIGEPQRDASGRVNNAVLILHGTNRRGGVFLVPSFAGALFGSGQLLDTSEVLRDSSRSARRWRREILETERRPAGEIPPLRLRGHGPRSQAAPREGLQVNHLRLMIGASMGCMEGWMWGESNPDDMDALLLLSCLPVADRRAQPHGAKNNGRRHSS